MSIINKMHQDFQQMQQAQPILAAMPKKKGISKALLLSAIILLTVSSLALSYLIFAQDSSHAKPEIAMLETVKPVMAAALKKAVNSRITLQEEAVVNAVPVKTIKSSFNRLPVKDKTLVDAASVKKVERAATARKKPLPAVNVKSAAHKEKKALPQPLIKKTAAQISAQSKRVTPSLKKGTPVSGESGKSSSLEIKTVKLSHAQLAHIHLKEADKAQAQGKLKQAAKERERALALLPTLDKERKSLTLYYYSQGNIIKASRLLKVGALVSPDYADFNLMLARIALKAGDSRKAYLYLKQNPPQIAGNLDYYVSYAILAQKFQQYEQAEKLYTSLLSQRPNNGRWRMALAIAQDKQAKVELALSSYKKALLQADLSLKAKTYIKQRLAYLEQQ